MDAEGDADPLDEGADGAGLGVGVHPASTQTATAASVRAAARR